MRGRKKRKSHVPRHFVGQISIDLNQISTYLCNAVSLLRVRMYFEVQKIYRNEAVSLPNRFEAKKTMDCRHWKKRLATECRLCCLHFVHGKY